MKQRKKFFALVLALCMSMAACGEGDAPQNSNSTIQEVESLSSESAGEPEVQEPEVQIDYEAYFKSMSKSKSYKGLNDTNPIMTQRFGADPYAMEYDGRLYIYMTADAFEYDAKGEIKENTYSQIRSINVVSTDDMVNFTDHGSIQVAGKNGAAKWAGNSWAPAAAWKMIDGKPKFFLYFANSGGGIGVLTADSPVGPFTDPIGKELISRNTPNCADVLWLFDPAVLVDDDGRAYIYFGGGVPQDKISAPGTGRVMELGEDMISVKGEAVTIDIPYLFEDSGIHKFGNKYYYTYCTNWQVDEEGTKKYGFYNAEIAMLESDSPMGPFKYKETILDNPGKWIGLYSNNHHCVFSFQGRWYMTYHSKIVEKNMGIDKGYRSTNINEFTIAEDGTIGKIKQSLSGREQLKLVDAYAENSAVMIAVQGGLDTVAEPDGAAGSMLLSAIDSGDFLKVQGVDFGANGAKTLEVTARITEKSDALCAIQIRVDSMFGDVLGVLPVSEDNAETTADGYVKCRVTLDREVTGAHDLFFVFAGSGYELKSWRFE